MFFDVEGNVLGYLEEFFFQGYLVMLDNVFGYQYLVSKGQGCYKIFFNVQDSFYNYNYLVLNVSDSEGKKYFFGVIIIIIIFISNVVLSIWF